MLYMSGVKAGLAILAMVTIAASFVSKSDSSLIRDYLGLGNGVQRTAIADSVIVYDGGVIKVAKNPNRHQTASNITELTTAIGLVDSISHHIDIVDTIEISANYDIPGFVVLSASGNGIFRIVSGCTLTINGTVDRRYRRWFMGDGVVYFDSANVIVTPEMWGVTWGSDCRRSIENAAASLLRGGKLYFGNNTYQIDSAVRVFNDQPVTIEGCGFSSIIYQTDSLQGRHGFWIGKGNKTIRNLKIVGTVGYRQNMGIYVADHENVSTLVSNISISNCWIEDFNSGIVAAYCRNIQINDNKIYNNNLKYLNGAGVQIGSPQDAWITKNEIHSNSDSCQHGIYINNTIRNCWIVDNVMSGKFHSCGIQARIDHSGSGVYADGLWIRGNHIDSCGNTGILIYSTSGDDHNTENKNIYVDDNKIRHVRSLSPNSGRGIALALYGIDGYSVNNNTIDSIDGVGIEYSIKIGGWNRNGTTDGNKISYWDQGDHGAAWAGIYCVSNQYMQNLSFSKNMLTVDSGLATEPLPIYVYRSSDDSKRKNIILEGNQVLNSSKDLSGYVAWNRTVRQSNNSWNRNTTHMDDASPSSGEWLQGDFVRDTTPGFIGTDSQFVNIGWVRAVTGSNNVMGYDWRYVRAFAKNPRFPTFDSAVIKNNLKITTNTVTWPATQYKIALNNRFGLHAVDNSYSILMHNTYYSSGYKYATSGGSFSDASYMRLGALGILFATAGTSTGAGDAVSFNYPFYMDTFGRSSAGFTSGLAAKFSINGGLWVGATTDPGDNNIGLDGRFFNKQGLTVNAVESLTVGAGNSFFIAGSDTIESIDTTNWKIGSRILLETNSSPLLKHGVTTGASCVPLYLRGGNDWQMVAGNIVEFYYNGTHWKEISREDNWRSLLVSHVTGLEDSLATKALRLHGIAAGRVPVATSTTAWDNSQIFDDGTNVGIGTTSPLCRADVSGGVRALSVASPWPTGGKGLELVNASDTSYIQSVNRTSTPVGMPLKFLASRIDLHTGSEVTSANRRMRIDENGNTQITGNFVLPTLKRITPDTSVALGPWFRFQDGSFFLMGNSDSAGIIESNVVDIRGDRGKFAFDQMTLGAQPSDSLHIKAEKITWSAQGYVSCSLETLGGHSHNTGGMRYSKFGNAVSYQPTTISVGTFTYTPASINMYLGASTYEIPEPWGGWPLVGSIVIYCSTDGLLQCIYVVEDTDKRNFIIYRADGQNFASGTTLTLYAQLISYMSID